MICPGLNRRTGDHRTIRLSGGCGLRPLVISAAVCLLLSGCTQLSGSRPDGPWHEAYRPIDDPESDAFVADALEQATARYGEPVLPVRRILLRRSQKTERARRYPIAEDFSLTECVDPTNGVFVIYVAVDPGHPNYYALLGHECAHLLDPRIFDWYMEGFATVFSREICEQTGRGWGDWDRHFEQTRREPYGLSYRMMRALQAACPDEYPAIFRHTAANGSGRRHIDIDAWLATLHPDRRRQAADIISEYADALQRRASDQYFFLPPAAKP